MRHCVNDVRKGRQFLRRPMYRPAIPTAPKCGLRPHFGAGTQVLPKAIKIIGLKTTKKKWKSRFPHYKSIGVFFRRSRADNSILCGPIGSKFELLLDIMHVLNTYKLKMDQINSNREKVATSIFRRSMAASSVVRGQIWQNFKLIQALMSAIITCKYEKYLIKNS